MGLDLSNLAVLVVDDSVHMRRIARMLLSGLGVRNFHEAEDGAVALERFQEICPDIVITDWVMPVFDGIELTRAIRNPDTSMNPYTPVIMMTGHAERRRVLTARDAGITEFLAKPLSARDLYLRIENCVSNPRQFVKTQTFFGPDRRRFVHPNYSGDFKRADDDAENESVELGEDDEEKSATDNPEASTPSDEKVEGSDNNSAQDAVDALFA